MKLTGPQISCLTSSASVVVFCGGIGSGKTTAIGTCLLKHAYSKPLVIGLFAPTYLILRNSTMREVLRVFGEYGLHEDIDYVVNVNPPYHWGVRPYSRPSSSGVLTLRNGSYIIFGSLQDENRIRGMNLDVAMVDEFRDVPDQSNAFNVISGRLRGKHGTRQMYIFTSPPDEVEFMLRLKETADVDFISARTDSNPFLPADYIVRLRERLSPIAFRREVLGELISLKGIVFAGDFDKAKHVKATVDFTADEIIYLSFDFNISPATCTAWRLENVMGGFAECVREFHLTGSIYDLCDRIQISYPHNMFSVTGDATGSSRQGAVRGMSSFYDVIAGCLSLPRMRAFDVPAKNPTHKASWLLCNSLLSTFPVVIDPCCKLFIRDLETVKYDAVLGIDKRDKERGHLLDTFRYMASTYFGWYLRSGDTRIPFSSPQAEYAYV